MKRILSILLSVTTVATARSQQPEQSLATPDTPPLQRSHYELKLSPVWGDLDGRDHLSSWIDPDGREYPVSMERFVKRHRLEPLSKFELFHYEMRSGGFGLHNGQAHNWHSFPGDFPIGYLDARTLSFPHSGRGGGKRR